MSTKHEDEVAMSEMANMQDYFVANGSVKNPDEDDRKIDSEEDLEDDYFLEDDDEDSDDEDYEGADDTYAL